MTWIWIVLGLMSWSMLGILYFMVKLDGTPVCLECATCDCPLHEAP